MQDRIQAQAPVIERIKHDVRRRTLAICARRMLSPNMLRLTLGGAELAGFTSSAPDDHIKLFVRDHDGVEVMRYYTPRRFYPDENRLDIDFALHDAGPATLWANNAQVGDRAEIGGPRGSQIVSGPISRWILIGDETALPAIARRVEELPPGVPVSSLVAIPTPEDKQDFETDADLSASWVCRTNPTDWTGLLAKLADMPVERDAFVWIAAEANVARHVRHHLEERGHPRGWMKASGYWIAGQAGESAKAL